jgi:hypothetical protein
MLKLTAYAPPGRGKYANSCDVTPDTLYCQRAMSLEKVDEIHVVSTPLSNPRTANTERPIPIDGSYPRNSVLKVMEGKVSMLTSAHWRLK